MFPLFSFASVPNKFVNKTSFSDSKLTLTYAHEYMHSSVSITPTIVTRLFRLE